METKLNRDASKLTVEIEGRLDTLTAPDLEKELEPALDGVTELILDLKDLEYISSAGLRALLSMKKELADKGKKIEVHNLNAVCSEVFRVTGMSNLLTVN